MFMQNVTVQAVSNKQKTFDTKFGPAYHFSFKAEDTWFQIPFVKAGTVPFGKDSVVTFSYETEQNGEWTNNRVNKKTLEIGGMAQSQQAAPQQAQRTSPPASNAPNSQRNTGITVGMAINNAVSLLGQGATTDAIHRKAWEIVKLSDQMNAEVAKGDCPFEGDVAPTESPEQAAQVDFGNDFDDDIPF